MAKEGMIINMEFFDMLGKKATEAYKVTADKTSKIAKETKLKFKIGDLRSKVNELYEEIGKKIYEQHVREEDYSIKDDLEELCTKIDVLSDEIDSLLKQCLELKDKKQCPKCFAEIEKEDKFCPKCGEKQTDEKPREVEILETLENSDVNDENETEKEIVKEELIDDIKEKEDVKGNKGAEKSENNQQDKKETENNNKKSDNNENENGYDKKDLKEKGKNDKNDKKEIEKKSKSDLQETVKIESDPKIKPGENDQYIKMEDQDPLDD